MKYSALYPNWKLENRSDLATVFENLVAPLSKYYSEDNARVIVEGAGYTSTEESSHLEGFSRVLWGLAPLLAGGFSSEWVARYQDGIKNGTNPKHPAYWGKAVDCDQRLVEMAAIAYSICLRKDLFWDAFTEKEQDNLYNWLNQINHVRVVDNNWSYFRILVDLAFNKVGKPYPQEIFDSTMKRIDSFYKGDGWYKDGDVGTYDYYNGWAFQFYGMVYYKEMREKDPERCEIYKKHIIEHAQQFKLWFAENGAAIPMGRSLTYRFGQCAFFSALALADIEALPWGECKHIVLQNFRYWLEQSLLDRDGVLSIGYTYPNLLMSEDYNSPTSPYWSFKSFAVLALPDTHPFWTAEETQLPEYEKISMQKTPGFIVQRIPEDDNVVLFSGKQYRWTDCNYFFSNFADKYGKFAYSIKNGFSISRAMFAPSQGAFDSTLALTEVGDTHYRTRNKQELVDITNKYLISRWQPWNNVTIDTLLIPLDGWHVRVHKIDSARKLETVEGGFCQMRSPLAVDDIKTNFDIPQGCFVKSSFGITGMVNLLGERTGDYVAPESNTNIVLQKTMLPELCGVINEGITYLACAVFASENIDYANKQLQKRFEVKETNGKIELSCDGKILVEVQL